LTYLYCYGNHTYQFKIALGRNNVWYIDHRIRRWNSLIEIN